MVSEERGKKKPDGTSTPVYCIIDTVKVGQTIQMKKKKRSIHETQGM